MNNHKKIFVLGGIGIVLFLFVWMCAVMFGIMVISGNLKTKAVGNKFQIVNAGTGSLGSQAEYVISPNNILKETGKIDKGVSSIKFGWKFEAVQEGECIIVVKTDEGGELSYVDAAAYDSLFVYS